MEGIILNLDESYINIDNLSNYFDKIYLKIIITTNDDEVSEYKTKLKFDKDFTNNKNYNENKISNDLILESKIPDIVNPKEIEEKLLKAKYKYVGNDLVYEDDNYEIKYNSNSNSIKIVYIVNNLKYDIRYNFYNKCLYVFVSYNNYISYEEYYFYLNNQKLNCIKGECKNYQDILNTLNKIIFKYLK